MSKTKFGSNAERDAWIYESAPSQSEPPATCSPSTMSWDETAQGVVHDVGNALSGIDSHAALILRQTLPAEIRADVEAIDRGCKRGRKLIDELLNGPDTKPRQAETYDANRLVTELFARRRPCVSPVAIVTVTSDEPAWIRVDRIHFERALENLVLNACEASQAGNSVHITVETGRNVSLHVKDQGRGIAPSLGASIFEPFVTTKESGSGLGLSSVAALSHASGARIRVRSQSGVGTTFSLIFEASAAPLSSGLDADSGIFRTSTTTILLCSKDRRLKERIARHLEPRGVRVLHSLGKGDALLSAERFPQPIDAVLCTVFDDWIGEAEFLARVAKLRPETRLLFCDPRAKLAPPVVAVPYPLDPAQLLRHITENRSESRARETG